MRGKINTTNATKENNNNNGTIIIIIIKRYKLENFFKWAYFTHARNFSTSGTLTRDPLLRRCTCICPQLWPNTICALTCTHLCIHMRSFTTSSRPDPLRRPRDPSYSDGIFVLTVIHRAYHKLVKYVFIKCTRVYRMPNKTNHLKRHFISINLVWYGTFVTYVNLEAI